MKINKKIKHENNGQCEKCLSIMLERGGINLDLKTWFQDLQKRHPEAHISCGARGRQDQEAMYNQGRSKARWMESAHNWGAAIDIFEMGGDRQNIYEPSWYGKVLKPEIETNVNLNWYGYPGSRFFELPHVELANWKHLVKCRKLKLCE